MKSFKYTGILIVLALSAFMTSCRSNPSRYRPVAGEVKVTVHTVSETNMRSEREYVGVVEESNNVMLSFPAPGKIKKVYISEGEAVSEGQLLAETDSETLENMHATAAATLRQAEDAWQRMTLLYESKSLPEIQYIEIQTKLEQARASERIAARALAETKLLAPQRGVVGKRMMEPGMNVLPDQPVMTLLNTHRPVVRVFVPENEIFDTRTGQNARMRVGALRDVEVTGKVIEKGVEAHPYTHGYTVRITLDREITGLLPGMVCKVYLSNLPADSVLVLPSRAVLPIEFGKGHFVWVLDQDDMVHRKTVSIGEIVQGGITVRAGLSLGDRVVVEGFQRLSENIKVVVTNE
jgi:RND family efflux transporter MFP subunit